MPSGKQRERQRPHSLPNGNRRKNSGLQVHAQNEGVPASLEEWQCCVSLHRGSGGVGGGQVTQSRANSEEQ